MPELLSKKPAVHTAHLSTLLGNFLSQLGDLLVGVSL
jgi:hypothetical protein